MRIPSPFFTKTNKVLLLISFKATLHANYIPGERFVSEVERETAFEFCN
jgi:hypothetical protein